LQHSNETKSANSHIDRLHHDQQHLKDCIAYCSLANPHSTRPSRRPLSRASQCLCPCNKWADITCTHHQHTCHMSRHDLNCFSHIVTTWSTSGVGSSTSEPSHSCCRLVAIKGGLPPWALSLKVPTIFLCLH
jgi:hypothetical protein